jgi:integrase/recombinase XerD
MPAEFLNLPHIPICRIQGDDDSCLYSTPALRELDYRVKKYPRRMAMQYLRQTLWYRVGIHACMKMEGHGQAKILTQQEIELFFNEGLQTPGDRTLFGVCLYTACTAEACSLKVIDVFTRRVSSAPLGSSAFVNTKGKLGTRTIPIIQELRLLLKTYKHPEHPYLFPSRHLNQRWKHTNLEAASHLFQSACDRVGIISPSTHSLRRSALTQMSNAGIPLRIIQEISGHRNARTVAEILRSAARPSARGSLCTLYPFLRQESH